MNCNEVNSSFAGVHKGRKTSVKDKLGEANHPPADGMAAQVFIQKYCLNVEYTVT